MGIVKWLGEFALTFALVFVVAAIVSFLWSLLVHGTGLADWGSAVRLGIIFGIVLTWTRARKPA